MLTDMKKKATSLPRYSSASYSIDNGTEANAEVFGERNLCAPHDGRDEEKDGDDKRYGLMFENEQYGERHQSMFLTRDSGKERACSKGKNRSREIDVAETYDEDVFCQESKQESFGLGLNTTLLKKSHNKGGFKFSKLPPGSSHSQRDTKLLHYSMADKFNVFQRGKFQKRTTNNISQKAVMRNIKPLLGRHKGKFVTLPDDEMERVVGVYEASDNKIKPQYGTIDDGKLPSFEYLEDSLKRITCMCVCESFDLKRLHDMFRDDFNASKVILYLEAVFASGICIDTAHNISNAAFIFFEYGVLCFWGCTVDIEEQIIRMIEDCMIEALPKAEWERDIFRYKYNSNEKSHIQNDTITIFRANNTNERIKMAISHALAQSTKLNVFEERVQRIIANTMHLPQTLARHGHLNQVSRKEISKLCGQVFLQKTAVNLLSSVLDTPEYFWSQEDSLQALYEKVGEYVEINVRTGIVRAFTIISVFPY